MRRPGEGGHDGEPVASALLRTRDRPALFAAALDSVRSQTLGDIEIVVVEDGGERYVADLADATGDHRIRVIRRDESHGPLVASRIALEAARGRYVAFLDDDDRWDPPFLETLVAALDANPDVVVAFCARRYIDVDDAELDPADPAVWFPNLPIPPRGRIKPFVHAALVDPVVHIAQASVIRRDALDADKLDPGVYAAWDRFVSYLLCRDGAAAWCEPEVMASYRIHPGSLTAMGSSEVRDGRVALARKMSTDPAIAAWHGPLRRQLAELLLERALTLADDADMRCARRDVLDALRASFSWRALRTLPALVLPPSTARRIRDGYRRVKSTASGARSAVPGAGRGHRSP